LNQKRWQPSKPGVLQKKETNCKNKKPRRIVHTKLERKEKKDATHTSHREEKALKPAREGEAPSLAISLIFANLVNSMVKKTHTFVAQFANLLVYMVQVRVFSCVT